MGLLDNSHNNSKAARLPALPAVPRGTDPAMHQLLEAIKERLEVREGSRGNQFEKVVTERRLAEFIASPEFKKLVTGATNTTTVVNQTGTTNVDAAIKRALLTIQPDIPSFKMDATISRLRDELLSRINSAEAASVMAAGKAVAQEATRRGNAIFAESQARIDDIAIEAQQRAAGIAANAESILLNALGIQNQAIYTQNTVASAKTELREEIQEGIAAEASERTTLAAQLRGGYTGNDLNAVTSGLFYQERVARAEATNSLAQQITLLSAGSGDQFDWSNIWYFDVGIEGWTGISTPTMSAGWLKPVGGPAVTSPGSLGIDGTKYTQIRFRVRKTGTLTWAGVVGWNGGTTTVDEPTYDSNGIGLVTVNMPWTGTINYIVVDAYTTQGTSSNYYELDWVAVGRPSPGASSAQLYTEEVARAAEDTALGLRIDAVVADTGDLLASITTETEARTAADSALASETKTLFSGLDANAEAVLRNSISTDTEIRERGRTQSIIQQSFTTDIQEGLSAEAAARLLLASQVNSNFATLTNDYYTKVSTDSAIANAITTLESEVNDNLATVLLDYYTEAQTDSAIASATTALETEVAGNLATALSSYYTESEADSAIATQVGFVSARLDSGDFAAVKTESSATASAVTGLQAQYSVKVTAGGKVAGFGLAVDSPIAGGGTSAFVIIADKFALVKDDSSSSVSPFAVDVSTGEVYIVGNLNVDGNVKIRGTTVTIADINTTANTALTNAGTALSDLANKLNKAGSDILSGAITFTSAGGFKTSGITIATDGSSSGTGVAITSAGIVGRNGSGITFAIDTSGNATFKGDITGASGTFAGSISTNGYVRASGNITSADGVASVVANDSGVAGYGTISYGGNVSLGAGVYGISPSITVFQGAGVKGLGRASNPGVWGFSFDGSPGMRCDGGFVWGSYTYSAPAGGTTTFMRNDGQWAAPSVDWSAVTGKPTTFTPSVHGHFLSDIQPNNFDTPSFQFSTDGGSTWTGILLKRL